MGAIKLLNKVEFMTQTKCQPLVLLTATVVEMQPLAKQLHLEQQSPLSWQGEVADMPVVAQVTGMGPIRASQAVREIAELFPEARILFTGFAGALDPSLDIGSVISPAVVCNSSNQTLNVDGQMPQIIVSVEKIISTPQQKSQLAIDTKAAAVDMESYAAAITANELGIPLTIIRAISDEAHQTLPTWSTRCIKENGMTNLGGVTRILLTGPWRISAMLMMQKRAKLASESLAYFVEGKIGQWAFN